MPDDTIDKDTCPLDDRSPTVDTRILHNPSGNPSYSLQSHVFGTAPLTGEKGGNPCKGRRSLASCVYAKQHSRANGRVTAILPECGVFGKRPNRTGQYSYS